MGGFTNYVFKNSGFPDPLGLRHSNLRFNFDNISPLFGFLPRDCPAQLFMTVLLWYCIIHYRDGMVLNWCK